MIPALALLATLPLSAGERREAAVGLDALLESPVGTTPASDWLATLDVEGCLRADRDEAVALLDGLRIWRATAAEDLEDRGARRLLRTRLRRASPEGRAVVDDWLDARALARERWLCEDGLPLPRSGVGPVELASRAAAWFAERITALTPTLEGGDDRLRERASSHLVERIGQLLARFDAMFAGRPELRSELEDTLWAAWEDRVEPWTLGWAGGGAPPPLEPDAMEVGAGGPGRPNLFGGARAAVDQYGSTPAASGAPDPFFWWDFEPGPRMPMDAEGNLENGVGWMDVGPAGLSDLAGSHNTSEVAAGGFLDPWDQAEVWRIAEGLRRQQRAIARDLRAEERRLAGLTGTSDDVARDAERSRRRLHRLRGDERRLADRIRGARANRPWITAALADQHKRDLLAATARGERRAERAMGRAEAARDAALDAGGQLPGGALQGRGGRAAEAEVVAGWTQEEAAGPAALDPPGDPGRAAARYEGPLPEPGPWDRDLVAWILRLHPRLDALDVRLLLELSHRALGQPRSAIEARVRALLDTRGRLALRGPEHRLSDLHRAGQAEGAPRELVFVVELPDGP